MPDEARRWLKKANKLEPFAAAGWLEHAKFEEEIGDLRKCQKVLSLGLMFCKYNDSLLIKTIKIEERLGNVNAVRSILSRLQSASVDKVWKTLLEGAMFESRRGNDAAARRVFRYLMTRIPWYGPVFFEACRFEEARESYENAIEVLEQGLQSVPRYGPLWFCGFRLYRRVRSETETRAFFAKAIESISPELVWKVHLEAARFAEEDGDFAASRAACLRAVLACPQNLRWKVWLSGVRMELRAGGGRESVARLLLDRSLSEAPKKSRGTVVLERSRFEEYCGNADVSRRILREARTELKQEWKLFLELVLVEIRDGCLAEAIAVAEDALVAHPSTGRLWAMLIQLKCIEGEEAQLEAFKAAIQVVPKSGEVWAEGSRLFMNPTSRMFNLPVSKQFLKYAITFTPQYGDSFVEYLRLDMLVKGQDVQAPDTQVFHRTLNADPNYGALWLHCKNQFGTDGMASCAETLEAARVMVREQLARHKSLYSRAILRGWESASSTEDENDVCFGGQGDGEQEEVATEEEMRDWLQSQVEQIHALYPVLSKTATDQERHKALFATDL